MSENIYTQAKSLGEAIRIKRINKHLKKTELSRLTGISTRQILAIEEGSSNVSFHNVLKLTSYLGINIFNEADEIRNIHFVDENLSNLKNLVDELDNALFISKF